MIHVLPPRARAGRRWQGPALRVEFSPETQPQSGLPPAEDRVRFVLVDAATNHSVPHRWWLAAGAIAVLCFSSIAILLATGGGVGEVSGSGRDVVQAAPLSIVSASEIGTVPLHGAKDELVQVSPGTKRRSFVLADRRIVTGRSPSTTYQHIALVARFNRDGEIDKHFGKSGTAQVRWRKFNNLLPMSIASTPEGGAVVLGLADFEIDDQEFSNLRPVVFRLNSAGHLDASFGRHGFAFPGRTDSQSSVVAAGIAVRSNGRIVFATNLGGPEVRVGQLTDSGVMDKSFGVGGWGRLGSASGSPAGLLLQPTGGVVVVTNIRKQSDGVLRGSCLANLLKKNGQLDGSFGGAGKVELGSSTGGSATCAAPTAGQGGTIYLSGTFASSLNERSAPKTLFLQRFTRDGSASPTWSGGEATTQSGLEPNEIAAGNSCALTGGSVASVGVSGVRWGILGYSSDGRPDSALTSSLAAKGTLLKRGDVHRCARLGGLLFLARGFSLARSPIAVQVLRTLP